MMLNAIQRSPQGMRALHIAVSCLAFAAYSVSGIVSAHAQCAASGALGSAGDASASQALEVVRDRRMQVAQSCPAGTAPGANGMCMPVAGSATVTSASAPNAQPPGQPKAKKAPGVAAAPAPGGAYGGLKDDVAPPLRPLYGVWAEGYGDHERRTNIAPQDQSVRFSSYGLMSGVDHTYFRTPREGILIGALAGLAVLTRTEFLLALLGGLFVLQTLSVILQVGFFKLSKGKRLFRMAPLHHHFEMLGWEEITVVIRFWLIAGIFVAAGLGVFYAEWVAGV